MTASTPSWQGRIAGLDAWRAWLMLAGIFVHGGIGLPTQPAFVVVTDVSQAFRMGVFFAISGFLAAVVLQRRRPSDWLRQRLRQLGVPAVAGVLLLSPLIHLIKATSRVPEPGPVTLLFEWHHLWFLFGLAAFTIVAVLLHEADRRFRLAAWIDARATGGRVVVLAVALLSALMFALVAPLLVRLSPDYVRAFGHVQMIAGYLPMFVFGFVLARARGLLERVTDARRFGWSVVVAMIAAYGATRPGAGLEALAEQARFLIAVLCPPAVALLVLRSALAIRRVPALVRHLSNASYTIYILHYPISMAINTRYGWQLEPHLAYLLSVAAAGTISFAIHLLLVRTVPLAGFLANGRALPLPRTTRFAVQPRPSM